MCIFRVNMPKYGKSKLRKRWSDEQCERIFDFLRLNPLMKPTSDEFFKKLSNDLGPGLSFSSTRYKVYNLLASYRKANRLISNSSGFPTQAVLKACPYYRQLHEVFNSSTVKRRNTTCARSQLPARSPAKGTATDVEDNVSECSSIARTIMVRLPSAHNATGIHTNQIVLRPLNVKNENFNANPRTEFQIASPEKPAPPENTHTQFEGEDGNICFNGSECEDIEAQEIATNATSNATEGQEEHIEFAEAQEICINQGSQMSEYDLKLMELRLREKELDVKIFEIESNERIMRLKLESQERIIMRKMDLICQKH